MVLHASERPTDRFILASFEVYLRDLGLYADLNRIFFAGKLCFMRLRANEQEAQDVPASPSCAWYGRCRGYVTPSRFCAACLQPDESSHCRHRVPSTRTCVSPFSTEDCLSRVR